MKVIVRIEIECEYKIVAYIFICNRGKMLKFCRNSFKLYILREAKVIRVREELLSIYM